MRRIRNLGSMATRVQPMETTPDRTAGIWPYRATWGGASGHHPGRHGAEVAQRAIAQRRSRGARSIIADHAGGTVVTTNEQANWINPRDPALALGPDGQPARSRRAPYYDDVSDEQWGDWKWQLSNRVNDLETFGQILELTDNEREGLGAPDKFRVDITPYFISLIDATDPNDPIRRQVMPLGDEQQAFTAMMEDSLREDRALPGPGAGAPLSRSSADAGDHAVRLVLPLLHALAHRRRRHAELQHGGLRGAARVPAPHATGSGCAALGWRPPDHVAQASRTRAARSARDPARRDRSVWARVSRSSCPSGSTRLSVRCSRSTTRCG